MKQVVRALLIALLSADAVATAITIPSHAATNDDACRDWAVLVMRIAQARDAGLSVVEAQLVVKASERPSGVASPDGIPVADLVAIVDALSAHAREVKAPSQALAGVVQIVAAVYAAPRLPPRDEAAAYYVACTGGLRWF